MATANGGRQRTCTDDLPQAMRAATLAVGACTWLRDEEAADSNPATPTSKTAGHTLLGGLRFAFRLCRCPILGAKWERPSVQAGRVPASSRLSNGTADTGDSAAR